MVAMSTLCTYKSSSRINLTHLSLYRAAKEFHEQYLKLDHLSHFSCLIEIQSYLTSISRFTDHLPNILWDEPADPHTPPTVTVHQIHFDMKNLQHEIQFHHDKFLRIVEEDLLFGTKLEDLFPTLGEKEYFEENEHYSTPGHNFMDLPANKALFSELRDHIVDTLSHQPEWNLKFIHTMSNGRPIYRLSALQWYLDRHSQALKHALWSLYWLNQAMRVTALCNLTLVNPFGRLRTFFTVKDVGAFVQGFGKNEGRSEGVSTEAIYLVPFSMFRGLCALSTPIRPFVRDLALQAYPLQRAQIHQMEPYLFATGPTRYNGDTVNAIFRDFTKVPFGKAFGPRIARQLSVGISERFLPQDLLRPLLHTVQGTSVIQHAQGHSGSIAKDHYAVQKPFSHTPAPAWFLQESCRASAATAMFWGFSYKSVRNVFSFYSILLTLV